MVYFQHPFLVINFGFIPLEVKIVRVHFSLTSGVKYNAPALRFSPIVVSTQATPWLEISKSMLLGVEMNKQTRRITVS